MAKDKFVLNVPQAQELNLGMNRLGNGDWTNEDVKALSEGNILGEFHGVIRGTHKIVVIGEPMAPACIWREENGVIHLSVVSDGKTGEEWIEFFETRGDRLGDQGKFILRSKKFKSTKGVTYKVAVLKGELFTDTDRVTKKIRAEAKRREYKELNAEVACLIRANFSDEDLKAMGLWWIVVMHDPINDSDGYPSLLSVLRYVHGRWLVAD